ncbi:hypothetical protein QAD02_018961 [Eretmocerus hayati]|uniref:Uncharacterized protein n=1 Tax=Eretmocerus hayati TaxID=131215 RepID=A0ACC2PHW1_9HYME|nr:hypothetical protein QAD02_018961 [Eretmocerus hayati]
MLKIYSTPAGSTKDIGMSLVGILATTSLLLILARSSESSPIKPIIPAGPWPSARIPIDHDRFLLVLLLNRHALPIEADGVGKMDDSSMWSPLSLPEYESDEEDPDEDQQPDPPPPPLQLLLNKDKRLGTLSPTDPVNVLRTRIMIENNRKGAQALQLIGSQQNMRKRAGHSLTQANLGRLHKAAEQLPFQL